MPVGCELGLVWVQVRTGGVLVGAGGVQVSTCGVLVGAGGGGKAKLNGGKLLRRAVDMAWQRRAGTQPAKQATAGEHSRRILRPAQASKKQRPPDGRPRSKTTAADVGRPLAVQCR